MLTEIAKFGGYVDKRRLEANRQLNALIKVSRGQFMTPFAVAEFMASLFSSTTPDEIRLLDAGAGTGSLTAAFINEFCQRSIQPKQIELTAYENDPLLVEYLQQTLRECNQLCEDSGVSFAPAILEQDFISAGADQLFMGMLPPRRFTHIVLNPPYKKINSSSQERRFLRSIGIETVNLYTGFLSIAIKLLEPGGELVAIVPRSFCNGPYYKSFRQLLLGEIALKRIHVFESRTETFQDDDVLQENIVFYGVKAQSPGPVVLSFSKDKELRQMRSHTLDFAQVVKPDDPDCFIHLLQNEQDAYFADCMSKLPCTLADLDLHVSTGPVVDFRLADYLRQEPGPDTIPLIYPLHCQGRIVEWPIQLSRKPNALADVEAVQKWLYPNDHYVVVRRFSSKEEVRRVVAALHDPTRVPGPKIAFENHTNVFHRNRRGFSAELARGLAVYLNSTFFDTCFRQFSGHTQVNVKDLESLRYPDLATLEKLGQLVKPDVFPGQPKIDKAVESELGLNV